MLVIIPTWPVAFLVTLVCYNYLLLLRFFLEL